MHVGDVFLEIAGQAGSVRAIAAHEGLFEPVVGIVSLRPVGAGAVKFPTMITQAGRGLEHGVAFVAGMTFARLMNANDVRFQKLVTSELLAAFWKERKGTKGVVDGTRE